MRDCSRDVSPLHHRDAEILPDFGIARIDPDRHPELSHPFPDTTGAEEVQAVVAHDQGVAARADRQGVGHECVRVPPGPALGPAHCRPDHDQAQPRCEDRQGDALGRRETATIRTDPPAASTNSGIVER